MRANNPDITTFIVHPGTGTIIDADEAVVINMDVTGRYDDDDIITEATDCGNTLYSMYVVMVGNIFDGFQTVGPFLNIEEAIAWGEDGWRTDSACSLDWYTCQITSPWEYTK